MVPGILVACHINTPFPCYDVKGDSIVIISLILFFVYKKEWYYTALFYVTYSTFPPAYLAQKLDFSAGIVKKLVP